MRSGTGLALTANDRALLGGEHGEGAALAMRLVVKLAEVADAAELVDIESAHVDGCLYHGQAGIDFARRLLDGGARVAVPTTLNVSSLDLLHPELYRGDAEMAAAGRDLMDLHVELGCRPTWTCAPYHLADRPGLGEQIAWGESNAIVFANSVLGARTNRYGDFADLACAITGRAPLAGLHTDKGREGSVVVELDIEPAWLDHDLFYPLLGHWIGANCGIEIPVIVGLDERAGEDRLKALGAAAASAGATAMFHAVGVTPEADTLERASAPGARRVEVSAESIRGIRRELGASRGPLGAVSVGTPHMSQTGLDLLGNLVSGLRARVPFYVNTSRDILDSASDWSIGQIEAFGATFVTDTCTYVTPIIGNVEGPVMTDSGKWAYYAPGNLGVQVVLAGLSECVESAASGAIELDDPFQ